jgi:hypothetical protein
VAMLSFGSRRMACEHWIGLHISDASFACYPDGSSKENCSSHQDFAENVTSVSQGVGGGSGRIPDPYVVHVELLRRLIDAFATVNTMPWF